MTQSILVVGCGITGAVTAFLLSKLSHHNLMISCWDKARGAGGRMATTRNRENSNSTADTGAQYISVTSSYFQKHKHYYDDLLVSELLTPFAGTLEGSKHDTEVEHFVAPKGVNSLVKHFLTLSGARLNYNQQVTQIKDNNGKWLVKTLDGKIESFDCVVLTPPVPQILQLGGDIHQLLSSQPEIKENLKAVEYSSRYALAVFFADDAEINVQWSSIYVTDNHCIRFLSIDNKKRGHFNAKPISMVVHTSVPFGLQHLEDDKEDVKSLIMDNLRTVIPELPEPTEVKCQKWRYSQITKAYQGSPGCVIINDNPLLLCGGDAFTHSNFDGCISSATKIVETIANVLMNDRK